MGWKDWPSWMKGGIIFFLYSLILGTIVIISLILFLPKTPNYIIFIPSVLNFLITPFPFSLVSYWFTEVSVFITSSIILAKIISSIIVILITGSLFGFIYGKVVKRQNWFYFVFKSVITSYLWVHAIEAIILLILFIMNEYNCVGNPNCGGGFTFMFVIIPTFLVLLGISVIIGAIVGFIKYRKLKFKNQTQLNLKKKR